MQTNKQADIRRGGLNKEEKACASLTVMVNSHLFTKLCQIWYQNDQIETAFKSAAISLIKYSEIRFCVFNDLIPA